MNAWSNLSVTSPIHCDGDRGGKTRHRLSDIKSLQVLLEDIYSTKRSYYNLEEMALKWDCPIQGLLDLGWQDKLRLSVIAANWRVLDASRTSADSAQLKEKNSQRTVMQHVDLTREGVLGLINAGETEVQYVLDELGNCLEVMMDDGKELPAVKLDNVHITHQNAIDYLNLRISELAPKPTEPSTHKKNVYSANYRNRTTDQIAKLFRVTDLGEKENREMWRKFAHHANRNGLAAARAIPASSKQGRTQSIFNPEKVGQWLVNNNHLDPERVGKILEKILGESTV